MLRRMLVLLSSCARAYSVTGKALYRTGRGREGETIFNYNIYTMNGVVVTSGGLSYVSRIGSRSRVSSFYRSERSN